MGGSVCPSGIRRLPPDMPSEAAVLKEGTAASPVVPASLLGFVASYHRNDPPEILRVLRISAGEGTGEGRIVSVHCGILTRARHPFRVWGFSMVEVG